MENLIHSRVYDILDKVFIKRHKADAFSWLK